MRRAHASSHLWYVLGHISIRPIGSAHDSMSDGPPPQTTPYSTISCCGSRLRSFPCSSSSSTALTTSTGHASSPPLTSSIMMALATVLDIGARVSACSRTSRRGKQMASRSSSTGAQRARGWMRSRWGRRSVWTESGTLSVNFGWKCGTEAPFFSYLYRVRYVSTIMHDLSTTSFHSLLSLAGFTRLRPWSGM